MVAKHEQLKKLETIQPIPELPDLTGWKQIPIVEGERSREPLVPVGLFSDHVDILTSSVYANEHHNSPYGGGLEGSNITVFMRKGVAGKLDVAASILPSGQYLMVMDGYRSLEVQGSLYKQYESGVVEQHPDWTEDEVATETQKYVSAPSTDPTKPSPHNTGASVDVVIVEVDASAQRVIEKIDERLQLLDESDWQGHYLLVMRRDALLRRSAKMLDFGTRFDYGGPEAALRYLEEKATAQELTPEEERALHNRRLLFSVMTAAGLEPYADEWWHYNDPASQMGAKVAGRESAEYGAVTMSRENKEFAQMRNAHHRNSVLLANGYEWTPPKGLEEHYELARRAVWANDLKNVWDLTMTVAKIEPPKEDKAA